MAIVKQTEISGATGQPVSRFGQRERELLKVSNTYVPASSSNWTTGVGSASAPSTLDGALDDLASSASGGLFKTIAVTWDFSVNGGAVSTIASGSTIPDNAIVVEVVADILTALSGAGTLKLNLTTDGDLTPAINTDALQVYNSTDTLPLKTAGSRAINFIISSAILTAGKVRFFIRYYQSI